MYTVQGFNAENGEIVFKFTNGDLKTINLYESNLKKYQGVNPKSHYVDSVSENIVKLFSNRVIVVDNGIIYRRATQSQYDKWMTKEFPDSDNAKVYNILVGINDNDHDNYNDNSNYTTFESRRNNSNLYSVGDTDSSDDEDPYYRGNIEDFVKGC